MRAHCIMIACSFFFGLRNGRALERDAAHILRLTEFIKQHARCKKNLVQLDHWRPDIARIDAVARATILLEKGQYRDALRIACDVIRNFEAVADVAPDNGTLAKALLRSVRESLANRPDLRKDEESLFVRTQRLLDDPLSRSRGFPRRLARHPLPRVAATLSRTRVPRQRIACLPYTYGCTHSAAGSRREPTSARCIRNY